MPRTESQKRYYERNREKILLKQKKYRSCEKNKEKHRLYNAEWRRKNPEKSKLINKKFRETHKDRINAVRREKLKTDPVFYNKTRESNAKYTKSGRRKELYHLNPLKGEKLKKRWDKIKNDPDAKSKIDKYRNHYRKNVLIEKEKEGRKTLSDNYIKAVIKKQLKYKIGSTNIPNEIIEVKRNTLLLKRKIKENAKA